uniref:Venom S1 protease 28 n=1 Tax=Ectomocoris sp. TaxID=3104572 RepID=A0AB38ZEC3_9HEMI
MCKKFYFTVLLLVSLFGLGSLYPSPDNGMDSQDTSDSDSNEHGVVETEHTTNCSCGWANKDDQRIVGGKATKVNEYPMMAGFVYLEEDKVLCGGTIITQRHIITAAHCTEPFTPEEYGIFIGHHNYKKAKNEINLLAPEKFIEHENYDSFTLKYDISLVIMKEIIEFSKNVGPACMPKTTDLNVIKHRVKILGWGLTRYKGKTSDTLLKVNVDVQEFNTCVEKNIHLELQDIHQLCTFRKSKDSCSGDSGGPLLWVDPDTNRYTLVALTSYGTNCAKYPAVNSDITYFLYWIQQKIAETDSTMRTCAKN